MILKYLQFLICSCSILLVTLLFNSCKDNSNNDQNPTIDKTSKAKGIDTTIYTFKNFSKIDSIDITSELYDKASTLTDPAGKYHLIKKGVIKKESSNVIRAMAEKPELCFSSKYCYKLKDIQLLTEAIHQINYIKLNQDSKDKGKEAVVIEELIFYSSQDAKSLQDYIRYCRAISFFWKTIDKTPSDLFRRGNKLYFVKLPRRTHTGSGEFLGLSSQLKK